ncbi:substrate-binding domain-containing protein [Microbacterium elymi]
MCPRRPPPPRKLTTVAQPLHDMGAQALRMVLEMLRRGEPEQQYVHLPAHLVVRQSTGPVPVPPAHDRAR